MRFGVRELIFILLLLAMPLAAYFFVFDPRNTQISEAREEITQKQMKLKQLETATRSMVDLGKEIDKLSKAIELFEHKLPVQREVEVILKEVWELTATHHLTIKSVRPDKAINSAQYSEQQIKLVILGEFDGFYGFLMDLEKLKRITRMPKMTLKRSVGSNTGRMQADLILSIFFDSTEENNKSSDREQS